MRRATAELTILERLVPTENGITVFDAETQETSYGIWLFDGLPFIFDTHRKLGWYVTTIELLTEVVTPVRIAASRVERFCDALRKAGLLPIPYTGCFFRENLHVYSFDSPVRGFDFAAIGSSVAAAERFLADRIARMWPRIPKELLRAQRGLLERRRKVRHTADLQVLLRRWRDARNQHPV